MKRIEACAPILFLRYIHMQSSYWTGKLNNLRILLFLLGLFSIFFRKNMNRPKKRLTITALTQTPKKRWKTVAKYFVELFFFVFALRSAVVACGFVNLCPENRIRLRDSCIFCVHCLRWKCLHKIICNKLYRHWMDAN